MVKSRDGKSPVSLMATREMGLCSSIVVVYYVELHWSLDLTRSHPLTFLPIALVWLEICWTSNNIAVIVREKKSSDEPLPDRLNCWSHVFADISAFLGLMSVSVFLANVLTLLIKCWLKHTCLFLKKIIYDSCCVKLHVVLWRGIYQVNFISVNREILLLLN